jgi:integrase
MGNLHKRNGVFYADYIDRNGQRQQPSLRTRDREVARAKLRDLELQTTDRSPHQTEDLSDALDYFTDVTLAGRPAGTVRSYKQKACHLHRLLDGTLLDAMKREHVERYIATRIGEGAHTHSVHKELVVLRGALKSAKERDRFHGSLDVVPRFGAGYEPRRTYLTPEQFMRLTESIVRPIGTAATDAQRARWEARKVRRTLYVLLIALASPRKGEIEAMRWEQHVHLGRGFVQVPKGKTRSRPIAIHPVLRLWLETYQQTSGPVVEPWGNVSRDLPAICERAGVPRCTPNDLRRTFASWLVQQGESLFVVSRLLGHSSTRMVELVYGQLDEATLARAIDKLPGGSHAGYTNTLPNRVTGGAIGTSSTAPTISNSVEDSVISSTSGVPRDGVEPPTRGFSVPLPNEPNPVPTRAKLKLVG